MPQALILLNRGRETRVCADGWQSFGVRLDSELPATADSESSGEAWQTCESGQGGENVKLHS